MKRRLSDKEMPGPMDLGPRNPPEYYEMTEDEAEEYEERAAIMEYEGDQLRDLAEWWAMRRILEKRRKSWLGRDR